MTRKTKTNEERFWPKVEKTDGCWNWTACTMKQGYGVFRLATGKTELAHRYAYQIANGELPADTEVDHACFNRTCVNPSHLRAVTRKQNSEHRRGAHTNNRSSGVRGVYRAEGRKKWVARVCHNQVMHHLGVFDTVAEAEAVVTAKRIKLFTHNDIDRQASEMAPHG